MANVVLVEDRKQAWDKIDEITDKKFIVGTGYTYPEPFCVVTDYEEYRIWNTKDNQLADIHTIVRIK